MNKEILNTMLNAHTNSSQLQNALMLVRDRKFIVGSIDETGKISFSDRPVRHDTPTSAKNETLRLAGMNPGKTFIYVQVQGGSLVPRVVGHVDL